MKFLILGAVVLAGGIATYLSTQTADDPATAWKRAAIEKETATRPDRFEAMKFDGGTEVRQPASQEK